MEEEFLKLEIDQQWESHFMELLARSPAHSTEIGDSSANRQLNRYLNVSPFDQSRVRLTRAKDTDYINASIVTVPKAARRYILTQGPLPNTVEHFWLMVWEQKTNIIVMLNRLMELEKFPKCERYWPASWKKDMVFEDVGLKVKLTKTISDKHYTTREMELVDLETQTVRHITQYQYTAWPDHGEPSSPTSFLRLLTAIRKNGGLDKMDEPPIIHCSAGVGRSGTFCLIDSILTIVENQGSTEGIDLVNTLLEMRDQRMGLIQTAVQLRFAYMSIIYGIKILENAKMLHPHLSSFKHSPTNDKFSSQTSEAGDDEKTSIKAKESNGAGALNGKKTRRRTKKKQNGATQIASHNIFKKELLVEALDGMESDSADRLVYVAIKPGPNLKKARSSPLPNEQLTETQSSGSESPTEPTNQSALLSSELNQASNDQGENPSAESDVLVSNASISQNPNSELLRRRHERETKLGEKVQNIKKKMQENSLAAKKTEKRRQLLKTCFTYGGATALVLGIVAYAYIHGSFS